MLFSKIFNKVPTITADKLADLISKEPSIKIFDVRTPPEFHTAHLPNTRNYPFVQIDSYIGDKKEKIYLISQNGKLAKQAVIILRNKGYRAILIKDGMKNWQGKIISDK